MKRGFILTESEKNRIKNLYGTLTEQETEYQLDTVDKVQEFQDWMDGKFGKWAASIKSPGSFYKVGQREQYGWGHLRSQTKKAWATYKDEYLKEKKLGKYSDTDKTEVKPPSTTTTSQTGETDPNVVVSPATTYAPEIEDDREPTEIRFEQ